MPAEVYCEGDDRTYTVTSVKDRTFFQNQNIFKLTLPDTIEEMGERPLTRCSMLRSSMCPRI